MYIDLLVFIIYLVGITCVGLWAGRRENKTTTGYFLGGRKFTWWMIGASLFATNISSTQMVAQSGDAYRSGIAAANPQLMGAIMLGVAAAFFIPLYVRTGIYTIPQFLERRFSRGCKSFNALVVVLHAFLIAPIGFYASSLAAVEIFRLDPAWLPWIAAGIGLTVGLYAVIGGLTSVVVTDVIQVTLIIGGAVTVLVVGLLRIDDFALFWETMRPTHLELIQPADSPSWPWTGVFTGLALGSLFWATSNAGLLQRTLGAQNEAHAQGGMILAAFLKITALFIIVAPGVLAAYLFPGINPEAAYAVMVRELMPVGLSGLILAALLAAMMSSEDSGVCNISSLVALDLYPLVRPHATDRQRLRVGRITGVMIIVVGVIFSPWVAEVDSVFRYMLRMGAYLVTPIGVCFLIGRFYRRANHHGALVTLWTGLVLGTLTILLTTTETLRPWAPNWMLETNFYIISFVYALFYTAVMILVSLASPPPNPDKLVCLDVKRATQGDDQCVKTAWYARASIWFFLLIVIWLIVYFVL